MPVAADDHLGRLDHGPGGRGQPGHPVLADADDMQPGRLIRPGSPAASAFTAAAAIAEPPRRPRSAMKSQPRGSAASSALDSAAPTNPTGKPRISAGFGQPSSSRSSRWNSAVGALPIATTAPSIRSRHNSTAAAERVVPKSGRQRRPPAGRSA